MGENLAVEALQKVDELEAALRRLTYQAVTGPPVDHNLAEQRSGFFYGTRRDVEAWERARVAREGS
jgi:hypothetical protein